jgi:hypothetical protein
VRSRVHLIEGSTNEGATIDEGATTNEGATDDDERVGDDDKGIFSDSSYDSDLAASSDFDDDCSDSEFDPDGEILDDVDEYDAPMFSYDPNDPCIDVNVVLPDVDQCKSAVTHHAILHDHAFKIVKKDQERFRAICKRADKGCKWTFSRLQARSTLDAR